MSVAILIEFKSRNRDELFIPVAAQGVYRNEWVGPARRLGLRWLPRFHTGASVNIEDLPAVLDEIRRVRAALADNPRKASVVERIDLVLESIGQVDPDDIARIFIG